MSQLRMTYPGSWNIYLSDYQANCSRGFRSPSTHGRETRGHLAEVERRRHFIPSSCCFSMHSTLRLARSQGLRAASCELFKVDEYCLSQIKNTVHGLTAFTTSFRIGITANVACDRLHAKASHCWRSSWASRTSCARITGFGSHLLETDDIPRYCSRSLGFGGGTGLTRQLYIPCVRVARIY
jgi:hypothetical protein